MTYAKGDRFLDRDTKRTDGRVIEVDEVDWSHHRGGSHAPYLVRTEVHPYNPSAVGRRYWISEQTLRERFTKISR